MPVNIISPEQEAEIVNLSKDGNSITEIAKRFKIDRRTVSKKLKKYNVETTPKYTFGSRVIKKEYAWVIQNLYENGLTKAQISRIYIVNVYLK